MWPLQEVCGDWTQSLWLRALSSLRSGLGRPPPLQGGGSVAALVPVAAVAGVRRGIPRVGARAPCTRPPSADAPPEGDSSSGRSDQPHGTLRPRHIGHTSSSGQGTSANTSVTNHTGHVLKAPHLGHDTPGTPPEGGHTSATPRSQHTSDTLVTSAPRQPMNHACALRWETRVWMGPVAARTWCRCPRTLEAQDAAPGGCA